MNKLELKVPPLLLVIIFATAMWLVSSILTSHLLQFSVHIILPIMLLILGGFVAFMGVYAFKKAQTTVNPMSPNSASSLVTSGIYNITRNPMYLGFLLSLIALMLYLGNYGNIILIGLFISYMNRFQITPEEKILLQLFGDTFVQYQQSVRRWI